MESSDSSLQKFLAELCPDDTQRLVSLCTCDSCVGGGEGYCSLHQCPSKTLLSMCLASFQF